MKKQLVIVLLAVVLFASLAMAADDKASLEMQQKYLEAKIGQLAAEFQLFTGDMQAMARKYPSFSKKLEAMFQDLIKETAGEIEKLNAELVEVNKKLLPPVKK